MQITKKDVEKIANLAKIKIDQLETESLLLDLNNIFCWINALKSIDVCVDIWHDTENPMMRERDDTICMDHKRDDMLSNAPKQELGFFVVPKVIG